MNANNNNHTNGTTTSEQLFSEAPASWNTRYLDPNGFECQITLRGESGSELLEKAASTNVITISISDIASRVVRGYGHLPGAHYSFQSDSTSSASSF